jgi:hypothetical protein
MSASGRPRVWLGIALLIFGTSALLFLSFNFWLPPVLLTGGLALVYTGNVVAQYLLEARGKRWLRQAKQQQAHYRAVLTSKKDRTMI